VNECGESVTIVKTRREFIGIGVPRTAAPAARAQEPAVISSPTTASALGNAKTWITDEHRRLQPAASLEWVAAPATDDLETITINPEKKYQEILGFGGAFSDASCYMFSQLSPAARAELFHTLFDPSQMALNVCRTCIGAADSATKIYSYDDGEVDPDLDRFTIQHDREYILPILRQARTLNPELFLFASPWSPPGWMKSNGSMLGGCMRHTYMPSYANYFLKYLRAYAAEGVPIHAVTIQNEVDADQDGTMPACAWPQDYEADFVTMHLGPLFQRSGVQTQIWLIDHNYNLWGRAIGELETPDVLKYSNAIAWHGYGEPEWINRVQDAFPQVEMYWTEGGPIYTAPEYLREWANWSRTFTNALRNCCRSVTVWNLATNEHGRPYVGAGASGVGGAMIIDSRTKQISFSGQFWALGHFSRFIQRGAYRIDSRSADKSLHHCAFQNPDKSFVVVLTNPGSERRLRLRLERQVATLALATNSVTTVVTPVRH
jgi:glucosylceramidase